MKTEKDLLDAIEKYREYHCDWYNIPFKSLSKEVLGVIFNLMLSYDYYICGVTDGDGYYPKNFWEVETPMYCIKKLKRVNTLGSKNKKLLYNILGEENVKDEKINMKTFLCNMKLQNDLDRFLYSTSNQNCVIAMGMDKNLDFEFVEYLREDEF